MTTLIDISLDALISNLNDNGFTVKFKIIDISLINKRNSRQKYGTYKSLKELYDLQYDIKNYGISIHIFKENKLHKVIMLTKVFHQEMNTLSFFYSNRLFFKSIKKDILDKLSEYEQKNKLGPVNNY